MATNLASEVLPRSFSAFLRGETRALTSMEADLVHAVGAAFHERGDLATAIDVFRLLVLGAPRDARSWASLAIVHEALEDFERAAELYGVASVAPNDEGWRVRAAVYRARALWWLARFDDAAEALATVDESDVDGSVRDMFLELRRDPRVRRLS